MLAGKDRGSWVKHSVKEYSELAEFTSYGFWVMGLRKGDHVVTISNNRPEWNFVDMGLSMSGLVHVPVYPSISEEDYLFILRDCKPKIILVSDRMLYDKITPLARKIDTVQEIYTFNDVEGIKNWKIIPELGRQHADTVAPLVEEVKRTIEPEEIVTMIYTSGTTGNPKGVMLTHANIMSNVTAISQVYALNHSHRTLSFLPICHVFERTINYYFQSVGISIYYAENMGTIADNLKEVKPHVFISVPRLLERTYDKIIQKGRDLSGVKRSLFFWAVNLGMRYKIPNGNGYFYKLLLRIADTLVFSKWRAALGGNIQLIVVGGAALQPRLATIFNAAGIPVVEGYGMTESSPVISTNREPWTGDFRIGTVGPPVPGVSVKIADDGEILCRGPNVMKGYFNDPATTQEVIDPEGWLHTGDIGIMVENRFLRITDRKKEMFKLSSGKYIAPQVIENKLKESVFIEQVMVIGENQKFASAIISPDFNFLHGWAIRHNVDFRDNEDLIRNPQLIARFQRVVNEMNKQLGLTEQIKRFRLVHEEWATATGELSPTLKLKRKILANRYEKLIQEIFSVQRGELDD
jgi:long-chain acyl-CoA synthetase